MAPRLQALVLVACAVLCAGLDASGSGRLRPKSFIQNPAVKQTLRVCNAYPFTSALDVYMQGGSVQLNRRPLVYKDCQDYKPSLHAGDRVDFKVGDASAGTFTISDLPQGDALMLLVIYRHDQASTAVAFQSHVFAPVQATQVAVFDTYKGPVQSELRIQDHADAATPASGVAHVNASARSEVLRYDSVVAIDSGAYELALTGPSDGKVHATSEFVALPKESYVMIRCGVASEDGVAYPEDIFVYPRSPRSALSFAARGRALNLAVAIVSAFAFASVL